ncbi:hypothetical protein ACTQ3M_09545 [Oscillospiraceae bacterium LCP25S3_E10]|nr:hypothetical protein [Ruminococcus sp.]MDD6447456.1 hypothetical protein [Ruminococcus sp.]MDY2856959.1 hypothetical protein [Oscillospiraceae bacterium]
MKKLLSLLILSALLCICLCGCGENNSEASNTAGTSTMPSLITDNG